MIEPAPESALLLIDFQRDFLRPDGRMPVCQAQVAPVLVAAARAMMRFRAAGRPVIAIGNEFRRSDWLMNLLRRGAAIEGTPGAAWDERLPLDGATYFAKWAGDAFVNPALEPWLRQARIRRLVLTGVFARACVTLTARGALARGFEVYALEDAIACASDATRARAVARLAQRGVHVVREAGRDDPRTFRQRTVQREHLVGCHIGEWDTDGVSRLNAIGDGYKQARRPNCVLGVAAGDTEIAD